MSHFAVKDVPIWLIGFLARVAIVCIPLLFFEEWKDALVKPISTWTQTLWIKAAIAVLVVVVADYAKDLYRDRRQLKQSNKAVGDTFHHLAAAQRNFLTKATSKLDGDARKEAFEDGLSHIEHITEIMYGKSRSNGEKITANLMIYRTQKGSGKKLTISFWGTRLTGRKDRTLKVDQSNLGPGAPRCATEDQWQYIADTHAKAVAAWFPERPDYRSIISIPVSTQDGRVLAVLNIDSTVKDAFQSLDTAKQKLKGPLEAILVTFRHILLHQNAEEQAAKVPVN